MYYNCKLGFGCSTLFRQDKRCALLRYSNANSEIGAKELTEKGVEFTYVPQTPISDITTEAAWLYNAIAKHFILPTYSAYDLRDENPNEVVGNKHILQTIKISLKHLDEYLKQADKDSFAKEVEQLANSLGYSTKDEHCKKVYETICDKKFHPAFNIDGLQRIAITFHSSKGLEFDQVFYLHRIIDWQRNKIFATTMLRLHERNQN